MAQRDIYIGKEIGNYRIERRIAGGSFGTVYLARHLHLKERTTAIKILHAVHLGSDEEKGQFLQEAQILERLKGLPNILPLLDVGFDGNFPYMITEYAERGSLRMHMRQSSGPLPLQKTLKIIEQVGKGLQCAHGKDVVHRDLKPENILFNAQGEALLADFGISTVLLTVSLHPTHVAGTPAYMAPEQFRSKICKESDQYALACIAYELLTGRKVFEAPDLASMGFLHMTEAPTPPRQLNPLIPVHVERILLKALSKQRTQRYPSVSAFVAALNNQAPAKAPIDQTAKGTDPRSNIDDEDWDALPPVQTPSPTSKLPKTPAETRAVPPTSRRNTSKVVAPGAAGAVTGARATRMLSHTETSIGQVPARATRNLSASGTRPPLQNPSPVSPRGPETGGTVKPHRTPPKRNRRRTPIIVALVIVILLVLGGGGWVVSAHPDMLHFLVSLPLATITITPASKTVQDNYVLPSVDGNSDIANRQVGVRQLTSTKTDTELVALTRFHQDPKAATGTITFSNFNTNNSQTVTKATVNFPVDNIQIAIDQDANIPAAKLVGTRVEPGKATVPAHAIQIGVAGNIPASAINVSPCCGTNTIQAQNPNAFTGGQDAVDYNFLKPAADGSGITSADQNSLETSARNDIKGQMKAGERLVSDITCETKTTSNIEPNAPQPTNVTTANVTISVTCNAQVYDANAVQTIAENALRQKVRGDPTLAGYVPVGKTVVQVQPVDGPITFVVTAKGVWSYQWTDANKQTLLNKIKDMTKAQAQALLSSYPGIDQANNPKVDIVDGGNLPNDVSRIQFVVNTVRGL